jgi:hypothetical protein
MRSAFVSLLRRVQYSASSVLQFLRVQQVKQPRRMIGFSGPGPSSAHRKA